MPDQTHGEPASPSPIDQLLRRARWVMRFERVWPAVVLAATLLAVFVALGWLGLWVSAPRPVRILGVVCLLLGFGVAALAAYRAGRPTRPELLNRLDRDSGLPHRPVSTALDQLAGPASDPTTRALWDLHRKRLDAVMGRVRVAAPSPRLVDRDPFALRAGVLLALVATALVAGPDKLGLVTAAFDWRGETAATPAYRVDAWVDPPAYTGKPPVVLFGAGQIGAGLTGETVQIIAVPVHSAVVVRASAPDGMDVTAEGALKAVEAKPPADAGDADRRGSSPKPGAAPSTAIAGEKHFTLDGNGRLTLAHEGTRLGSFQLQAIPDQPPTLAMVGQPKTGPRGALTLAYKIDDDYGVVDAEAAFSEPSFRGQSSTGRSLVPPPKMTLSLPSTAGRIGTAQTTTDLTEHPWAGAEVTAVLSARDEGGNTGLSQPIRLTLPARTFTKPLARALVEQRRNLVFDPDHRTRVGVALDALLIGPDQFGTSKAVYLGLYTARQRLETARTDEDLIGLSDYLWQMALRIEDGDLSAAQRDLRAAEQALREAMQNGASDDEIKKLAEALQQQMDKFLAELMQKQQPQQTGRADPNSKTVTQNDLNQMMKRMQDAAKAGDVAEAQRMLDQLQAMLDNLKTARNSSGTQASREMNRQMGELERMTRDQQAVRDKTFKQGRQASPPAPDNEDQAFDQDQPGAQPGDQDDADQQDQDDATPGQPQRPDDKQARQALKDQQQALRERLEQLQEQMRQLGMKGEKGLEDAGQAMKDAENALAQGQGNNRRAVEAQGKALEGLQKGASGLAQQMAQGQGEQPGNGEGQTGQGMAGQSGTDPLGRKRDGTGQTETRGAEIGEGVAARAQRVLQELRRRLGDPNRSPEEQDYLERLLKRY